MGEGGLSRASFGGSTGCYENRARVRLNPLAHNRIAGFELPRFDCTVVRLACDAVNVVVDVLGLNWPTDIHPFIEQ